MKKKSGNLLKAPHIFIYTERERNNIQNQIGVIHNQNSFIRKKYFISDENILILKHLNLIFLIVFLISYHWILFETYIYIYIYIKGLK